MKMYSFIDTPTGNGPHLLLGYKGEEETKAGPTHHSIKQKQTSSDYHHKDSSNKGHWGIFWRVLLAPSGQNIGCW